MKTVTGKIVSSKPVSISKAASVLSKFVSAETGASQAVTAYLRRATIAIDELVRLHSKPDRKKHKKQKLDPSAYVKKELLEDNVKDEGKSVNEVKEERSEGERKKKKKEKERSGEGKMGIGIKEEEKSQVESNLGEEIKRKKDKKRRERGNFEESGGEIGNKMKIKEEEYDGKMVIEEEKKKQKRKSREVDDEESSDKKKKKKKRKEDN